MKAYLVRAEFPGRTETMEVTVIPSFVKLLFLFNGLQYIASKSLEHHTKRR